VLVGCGAHETTGESNPSDAASTTSQLDGSVGVVGGHNPYVPSDGSIPVADDVFGGTPETAGQGFDFCGSRTPGEVMVSDAPAPSQGARFLRFIADPVCEKSCNPQNPSDAQVYAWPTSDYSFDIATGLYFDIIELSVMPSSGILRIYGTDDGCGANAPMTEVQLSALAIERTWGTRCIPLRPGNQKAIGIAVTAGNYEVGIDAIRFGAVCR
jgi:hypothetical protein